MSSEFTEEQRQIVLSGVSRMMQEKRSRIADSSGSFTANEHTGLQYLMARIETDLIDELNLILSAN